VTRYETGTCRKIVLAPGGFPLIHSPQEFGYIRRRLYLERAPQTQSETSRRAARGLGWGWFLDYGRNRWRTSIRMANEHQAAPPNRRIVGPATPETFRKAVSGPRREGRQKPSKQRRRLDHQLRRADGQRLRWQDGAVRTPRPRRWIGRAQQHHSCEVQGRGYAQILTAARTPTRTVVIRTLGQQPLSSFRRSLTCTIPDLHVRQQDARRIDVKAAQLRTRSRTAAHRPWWRACGRRMTKKRAIGSAAEAGGRLPPAPIRRTLALKQRVNPDSNVANLQRGAAVSARRDDRHQRSGDQFGERRRGLGGRLA